MDRARLEEIRRRVEAATDGPWLDNDYYKVIQTGNGELFAVCRYGNAPGNDKNMEFIAHARTDIPELLEYVDELEKKLSSRHNAPVHKDIDKYYGVPGL